MNLPASPQRLLSNCDIPRCRASLEIAGVCPTCDVSCARPLHIPEDDWQLAATPVVRVPPLWFLTTSTAYSARTTRGSCTPSHMRFATFPVRATNHLDTRPRRTWMNAAARWPTSPFAADESTAPEQDLPRNAFHTPRRIPLVDSRTASLQPLPSCRSIGLVACAMTAWQPSPLDSGEPESASHGISARHVSTMTHAPNLRRSTFPFPCSVGTEHRIERPFGPSGHRLRDDRCLQRLSPLWTQNVATTGFPALHCAVQAPRRADTCRRPTDLVCVGRLQGLAPSTSL